MNLSSQENRFYYNNSDYITYEKIGNGSTSIIFLHGFGASKNTWGDFYYKFDEEIYTCYLIDFKGFGDSSIPKDDNYSLKENAAIITKFINEKIENRYFLIGHSYGGGVSLLITTSNILNNSPSAMILLDCAAYNIDRPFFIKYLRTPILNQLLFVFSTPKIRSRFTINRIVLKQNASTEIYDRYEYSFKGSKKRYSFIRSAMQIDPEDYELLIAEYGNINLPTLIIWGANDKILSIKQGTLLSKQIKDSQLIKIENCGHIPHEERPDETFFHVEEFIKSL